MKQFSCIIFLFLFIHIPFAGGQNSESTQRKILVISSYSPVKEVSNLAISAFARQLKKNPDVAIYVEYLDSESTPVYGEWNQWMQLLFKAYTQKPDLIVIIGQEAWTSYRATCIDAWKNIPIVLGDVKKGSFHFETGREKRIQDVKEIKSTASTFGDFKVTGYYTEDFMEQNFRYIRQLQPQVRHILFFYDDRYQLAFFEKYLQDMISGIDSLQLHYLPGSKYSTGQLLDSIKAADSTYAFLSAGWYNDVNRYPHAYSMLLNELNRNPGKAVYQLYDQGFSPDNYIGGYFVNGEALGNDLAELVAHILRYGFENSPAFQQTPTPPAFHLNYSQIKALGIKKEAIPAHTVFTNTPPSILETHSKGILAVGIVFLFFVILTCILLFYKRRKEHIYRETYKRTQQLLTRMPYTAVVVNNHMEIINIINPLEDVFFNIDPGILIGKNISALIRSFPVFEKGGLLIRENLSKVYATQETVSFSFPLKRLAETVHLHVRIAPFGKKKMIAFVHNITSRINTEQEILRLKIFLQSIIDNLPLPVFVKNANDNFRYVYYNDKCIDFYGGVLEKILNKNDFEAGDLLAEQYMEEDLKVMASDTPLSFERVLYNQNHEPYRWGISTKTKLKNNDGSYYIIAVVMETTELRKKEQELHNIQKELSLALDAGSLSAWIYDINKRMFNSLYGETVSKDGLPFDSIYNIAHPDDQEKYVAFMDNLTSGKIKKEKEIFRFYQEGRYLWFETHAIGLASDKSNSIEYIVGTQKDITQDIEAEQKAKADKFKSDLAIQSSGLIQWDYDILAKTFISPNPESVIYNVYTPEEEYFSFFHPEEVHLFKNSLDKLIRKQNKVANIQLRQYRKGVLCWVEIHCVAFEYNETGELIKITGLLRDITEMKKLTDELATKEKAEELNRLKSAFLANMSHEIRTPLNAIVGFSNLMAQTDDAEEKQEFNKIIETNNELLLQLINDILDLSKIEAGQLDFVFTDIDMVQIFSNLEAIYRYKVKEGVQLISSLPDKACIIYSEKNRLTQVLSNFLTNACKFTSAGYIKMGYEHIKDGLRLYVTDTGKGISKENLPHVFERFAKFDSFIQGTGLGLSICHTIVQHLQGKIGVESEEGKGCTFWFTVPCAVKSMLPAEPGILPDTPNPEDAPGHLYTLLVAEDNDSNYLLISKILDKSYKLIRAVNGKEAVELHKQIHPDLILMDIKMPEMDGITATRLIRQNDTVTPILALTAHAFEENKEEALLAGCNGFLTKPVSITELKKAINAFEKQEGNFSN